MATKNINARIQHKIDTYSHWNLASNFRPLYGELIIFIPDDENDTRPIQMKIGNKKEDLLADLPFITNIIDDMIIEGSSNPVSGGAIYDVLYSEYSDLNAQTVDGLHLKVSSTVPLEGEEDENTIIFVI